MGSVLLETSDNHADHSLYKITVSPKRILRIDVLQDIREHDYLHETTFFTYVSVEEAIHSLRNNEVVDAVLLHGNVLVSAIKPLIDIARVKAVPVIWYTAQFEKTAKK